MRFEHHANLLAELRVAVGHERPQARVAIVDRDNGFGALAAAEPFGDSGERRHQTLHANRFEDVIRNPHVEATVQRLARAIARDDDDRQPAEMFCRANQGKRLESIEQREIGVEEQGVERLAFEALDGISTRVADVRVAAVHVLEQAADGDTRCWVAVAEQDLHGIAERTWDSSPD
ncbi:MAG: hypothetical protein QM736_17970 [Vicinamibacterales bacterium]